MTQPTSASGPAVEPLQADPSRVPVLDGDEMSAGKRAAAIGLTATGALLLLLGGTLQFLQGLAALIKGDFFVAAPNFTYSFNVGGWGWIHLVMGILMVVTGFALLLGAMWARIVGIVIALFSAMANFMFIPYYPAWAIIIIVLDVFLIWALSNYDRAID